MRKGFLDRVSEHRKALGRGQGVAEMADKREHRAGAFDRKAISMRIHMTLVIGVVFCSLIAFVILGAFDMLKFMTTPEDGIGALELWVVSTTVACLIAAIWDTRKRRGWGKRREQWRDE